MTGTLSNDHPTAMAQRWVMAVPWHAILRWGVPWDRFGLVARPARSADAVLFLERHFGIVSTSDAERTLASFAASACVRDAAWHLTNAVLVAELAFSAYLLDEARAWQAAVDAARALQRYHRGWFAMAEGYLRGLAAHRPDSPDEGARDLLTKLFAAPDSPWNTLAWATPLPELLPPPRAFHPEIEIHLDDPDDLEHVLATAPNGSRIRLGPGSYVGSFDLGQLGDRGAHVLERAEHAPLGSVVFEAAEAEPLFVFADGRGAVLRGITLRGSPDTPAVALHAGFLRLEECRFEGGHIGIEASPETVGPASSRIVQLDAVVFEGQSDSAVALVASTCRARDVAIHEIGGCGFSADESALRVEDAFVEAADRAGVLASGGEVELRKVRIHDAQRWGVALGKSARAVLHDVEVIRSIIGLRAAEGAGLVAERCRFADAATANVELLDIAWARFSDCHVTGGDWSGVWLHPGSDASFKGGQIGGSRLTCMMVEGGRDVTLQGVGMGPSREGGGLFLTAAAEVRAEQVFVSGAVLAGVELRGARLIASDLRVRGSAEGVLVRDGARFEGRRVDLAEIAGTGLWLAGGSATVDGLGLRKVAFGLVVGAQGVALARDLVCAHTPVAVQVESGRVALAGQLAFSGGTVRVRSGIFAARGLDGTPVSAHDASLHLESGRLGALDLQGRVRLVLVAMHGSDLLATSEEIEVVRNPPPPAITAITPLFVAGRADRVEEWAAPYDGALVVRIAHAIVRRLGLADLVVVRESGHGARIDGTLHAVARFAGAFEALFDEAGALGVMLAELVSVAPRTPMGPVGLA